MSDQMHCLIQRFSGLKVLVVGDVLLDAYLEGASGRLSREAPVPIVEITGLRESPGGAGNTALNLRSLGASVSILSVVGQDDEGSRLESQLRNRGVVTADLIRSSERQTCCKRRVLAGGQMVVRLDQGTTEPIGTGWETDLIGRLRRLYCNFDAVIVSDYGCGVMTPAVIRALGTLQEENPLLLVVDSRRNLAGYRDTGVSLVKPNFEEALRLLDIDSVPDEEIRAEKILPYAGEILNRSGALIAAVTLDSDGALVFERGSEPYRTYGLSGKTHPIGAGDTYIAAFTLALACGALTSAAAEMAGRAAAVSASKEGTNVCTLQELVAQVSFEGKYLTDLSRLALLLDFHRRQGRRIVFTNGCFDILHRGHITYLNRAKNPGDVLVVGVNSDASVGRLKGPERPINSLEDRVQVLAALTCVDYLAAFDGDTASDLIRVVRPDIFVKGGDYTKDRLPEAPVVEALGGTVRILPFLDNRSTTAIIERIKRKQVVPSSAKSIGLSPAN